MNPSNATTASVQPYLMFNGRCEEALKFYEGAVGAKVMMTVPFKNSPVPPQQEMPAGYEEKIMHAELRIGESTIMASDGMCHGSATFDGFSLSLILATEEETDRAFNGLAEGGQVRMPLEKTFFSPRFGMLTDRFGVSWMVMLRPKSAA
jgi:PhnB protein